MSFKEINKRLLNLYSQNYSLLTETIKEKNKSLKHKDRATNPLLLKIDENYVSAKLKIMVFGQETNTWLGEQNNAEFLGKIEPVHNLYESFFLSGDCYSYGGQFWNGINRLKQLIKKELNDDLGLVWNNVLKIGKCDIGTPFGSIQDIQFEYFDVIKKEIEILEPDLLIFLCGHSYDGKLKRTFGKINKLPIEGFTEKQLCKMELSNRIPAFRTYHPNYLWRNDIDNYFKAIIKRIKNDAQQR